MPIDRFFHPRAGTSRKVSDLSDLEFRAWWTYVVTADDYGVMPRSAVVLQAANKALAKRTTRQVTKALDAIVECGLLAPFEHQGDLFVCQLDWQDFQKVRYPRETHFPVPPADIISKCSGATAALFRQRSGNIPEIVPSIPRAYTRETADANGSRLEATGPRLPARPRTFGRIDLHSWQLHALIAMLGPHAEAFDLDAWVFGLSKLADARGLVLDKRTLWPWVQAELRAECERRGLTVAGEATATEADRVAKMQAQIAEMDKAAGVRR